MPRRFGSWFVPLHVIENLEYKNHKEQFGGEMEANRMLRKLLFFFMVAGLAAANAKTYNMNLFQPAMFGTTELKPGEYKIEVVDQKATVRNGKLQGECPVKV